MGETERPVLRIEACYACARDPGFGAVHVGCPRCKRTLGEPGAPQPKLMRVSESPLVYAKDEASKQA